MKKYRHNENKILHCMCQGNTFVYQEQVYTITISGKPQCLGARRDVIDAIAEWMEREMEYAYQLAFNDYGYLCSSSFAVVGFGAFGK